MDLSKEVIISGLQNDEACNKYIWSIDEKCLAVFKGGRSKRHCLSVIGQDYLIGSPANTDILNFWPLNKVEADSIDIKCPGQVTALDVSYNSRYCVAAIGLDLYLWQVITGQLICILPKNYDKVTCVKFSRDDRYIVSGRECGEVMVWKLDSCLSLTTSEDLKPIYTWDNHFEKIIDISVGSISMKAKIAVISRTWCSVYSFSVGHCIMTLSPKQDLMSVTMDHAELFVFVGTSGGDVILFHDFPEYTGNEEIMAKENSIENKKIKEDYGKIYKLHESGVTCLSTSFDGQLLLSGSLDCTVKIVNLYSQEPAQVIKHTGAVSNAFFSPCPKLFSNLPPKFNVNPFHFCFKTSDNRDEWEMKLEPFEIQPVISFDAEENPPEITDMLEKEEAIRKLKELRRINRQLYAFMTNVMSKKSDT